MAKVLNLPDGHCSLEFEFAEKEAVHAALAQLDEAISYEERPGSALITVSGSKLVADSDAMGMALISSDDAGDVVVRRIAKALHSRDS